MTVKLFQDAGGTIPAVLPGQPVGFIKRTKGSDDAKQATALSKPTLGRWSKAGVRNLATGAQAVGDSYYWMDTASGGGLTVTKIGHGIEGGVPYVDMRWQGTIDVANGQITQAFRSSATRVAAKVGEKYTGRFVARLIAGAVAETTPNAGFRTQITGVLEAGGYNEGHTSNPVRSNTDTFISHVFTINNANTAFSEFKIMYQGTLGDVVDATFRIKGLMFERSSSADTPFQFNYGPNNITETGVPDLWHLYNDGNDALNVTLPAGTYGLASIGIDRQIDIGTFVSDGTTPVNILRHERQLDVSYRLGAYSAAEELAIRDAWGRKYA